MGRFYVTRPPARKGGRPRGEWLRGTVSEVRDEAAVEAKALLDDPRDEITGVYLWSEKRQQYAGVWSKPQEV